MANQEEKEVIIRIFNPSSGKDLRIDYPELAEIAEFKDMDPSLVKFCWYIGNRTSPLFNLDRGEKVLKALDILYPRGYDKIEKFKKIAKGEFDDQLVAGINRMTKFQPGTRLRAKLIADYTFDQLEKLVHLTPEEMKGLDMGERKQYAELLKTAQNSIKEIVKNTESGFGVQVVENNSGAKKVLVSLKDL